MDKLLQLLFSGVALGTVYALLALGFVVVFKATQVVNFAHAGLLMVGTYCVARFRTVDGYPFPLAVHSSEGRRTNRWLLVGGRWSLRQECLEASRQGGRGFTDHQRVASGWTRVSRAHRRGAGAS